MSAPFLGVARSESGKVWRARLASNREAEAIAQRHDLPELLARVLAGRGVGIEEAERFLNPTLRALMPLPSAFADLEKGAERIAEAVIGGERIGIISDYDVDGVSSAALAVHYLRAVGAEPVVRIPDRMTEGYGPSERAVGALKDQGAALLLTLDCGVLAHDPLAHAEDIGLTAIVVDHHQAGAGLPRAHAVINPNRHDDLSGQGHLCAAGVLFVLTGAVNRALRSRGWFNEHRPEPNLLKWLELVALATVCDVVPLKGLNRAYVTQGLKIMARRENIGLAALADAARLKRKPDAYALGFILGPRLNAAGRIGHAGEALKLLTTDLRGEASQIAQALEITNKERQQIELDVVESAAIQAETALGARQAGPLVLVAGEGWHPGVLGLAAARLKERFNRPAIVLGYGKGQAVAQGSGRSIPGVDLGAAVRAAANAGLILKGGGHAMAAGLTVDRAKLGDLRAFLDERLGAATDLAAERVLELDGALSASGATLDLIELLEQAGPYGAGHPQPLFAFPAHRVAWADTAGSDHVRCQLAGPDGARVKAIAFRALGTPAGELLLTERKHPLHIAARLAIDEWNGQRAPSLHIEDVARVPQPT